MSLLKNSIKEKLSIIILCAGKGIRLKKITKTIPKPLIKVDNISILHHTLICLNNLDINQIAIVIGYLGNKIRDSILKLKRNNHTFRNKLLIIDAENQYELGPLYSFLSVTENKSFFTQNKYFLVMPGDTIFDFEILKEIIDIISNNSTIVQKYPFVFYRKIGLKTLKEYYKRNSLVSNVKIEFHESEIILKKIFQIKIKILSHNDILNQLIPVFVLPYNFIKLILNLRREIPNNTIWEALNYVINKDIKILAFRINDTHNFYDIDYKNDLKKKGKGQ